MRIVSLLPSATEIVAFLGMKDSLVGLSHECDWPYDLPDAPRLTRPRVDSSGSSREIDEEVRGVLEQGLSVYEVDVELLRRLEPDVILTQDQCSVCAVDLEQVQESLGELAGDVTLVSLEPSTLEEVLDSVEQVAEALGIPARGEDGRRKLRRAFDQLAQSVPPVPRGEKQPEVFPVEWLEPLMVAGHWIPDLIELAGGRCSASTPGSRSRTIGFEELMTVDPDALLVAPCGMDLMSTYDELASLETRDGWTSLSAVENGNVWVVDGNQYFNRPGPRLVDSLSILVRRLWPESFDPEEHDRLIAETLERETKALHE